MKQFETWPPPNWTEVVITWDIMLHSKKHNVHAIHNWVKDTDGGRYHLHGWKATEGFAYRFERKIDAVLFALTWA
jgi:hypothetical protein